MADVYKFRVKLKEFENIIWRDIEISSVSSVAKLGYTRLAAFDTTASHLFNIRFHGKRYEIIFDDDGFDFEPAVDPIRTKLFTLGLNIGNKLIMEYDYGVGWQFEIKLLSVNKMKRGAGSHYPYITDGKGKGIIEDMAPCELAEIIEKTYLQGSIPKIIDMFSGEEIEWDFRDFDLNYSNIFLKGYITKIQNAYEEYE